MINVSSLTSEQGQFPQGHMNGPARMRRREKRAAAREKLATEEANKQVESTANVEKTSLADKPAAEEATGKVKSADNVDKTRSEESADNAEQVEESKKTAEKAVDENVATEKVELDDEFCTDEVYNFKQTESRTVETQTLESGPLPSTPSSKPGFDYYSLSYEDLSD